MLIDFRRYDDALIISVFCVNAMYDFAKETKINHTLVTSLKDLQVRIDNQVRNSTQYNHDDIFYIKLSLDKLFTEIENTMAASDNQLTKSGKPFVSYLIKAVNNR